MCSNINKRFGTRRKCLLGPEHFSAFAEGPCTLILTFRERDRDFEGVAEEIAHLENSWAKRQEVDTQGEGAEMGTGERGGGRAVMDVTILGEEKDSDREG